ncbi:MAG: TIGR00730 family Rossman fold protein [Candidatus Paceibacterota bacterium]|jgi:hypothetical protein
MQQESKIRLNVPATQLPIRMLSRADLEEAARKRVLLIDKEFTRGFEFLGKYPKSVTFFGSARLGEHTKDYQHIRSIAKRVVEDLGYAVTTGGGPGLMEAANRGAYEAGGNSLGITIELPREQSTNPYVTDFIDFFYFFSRKVCMTYSAEAFVYGAGGFGTFDELFEILTLIQTKKIPRVPVILTGSKYWKPIEAVIKKQLLDSYRTINAEDLNLYTITDDVDEIINIIKQSPAGNGLPYHYNTPDIQ